MPKAASERLDLAARQGRDTDVAALDDVVAALERDESSGGSNEPGRHTDAAK